MAARVELREIGNEEGNRLLRMIRRSSGSVVTWRRAQIVLLAAQRMPPTRIAGVVFSDPDTVREVVHNFNRDGFDALYPRYRGGRPRSFTLPQRQAIKRIALAIPTDLGQPFATWSLAKLADQILERLGSTRVAQRQAALRAERPGYRARIRDRLLSGMISFRGTSRASPALSSWCPSGSLPQQGLFDPV